MKKSMQKTKMPQTGTEVQVEIAQADVHAAGIAFSEEDAARRAAQFEGMPTAHPPPGMQAHLTAHQELAMSVVNANLPDYLRGKK